MLNRLPVDAVAAAVFGGLLGALFVILGPGADVATNVMVGSVVFGSLGFVRWLHQVGDRSDAL